MEPITNETTQQPAAKNAKGGKRLKPGGKRPLVIACIVLAVTALFAGLYFYVHTLDTFGPNYAINGIDVSGLTPEEAQAKLDDALPGREITIVDPEQPDLVLMTIALADLGFDPQSADFWAGESFFYLHHDSTLLNEVLGYLDLGHTFSYPLEGGAFDTALQAIREQLSQDALDTAFSFHDDSLSITKARDGRTLDTEALRVRLRNCADTSHQVAAPFTGVPAKALTAQEIHDTLEAETRNASYDPATGTITPEQIGGTFDVTAAQAALDAAAPGETVTVPADVVLPEVTAADLEGTLFRDVLGECTTPVSGSAGRISNVRLSAAAFNGLVLNDGETLSYNQTTGQRTAAKGYQAAPAYFNGETVNEIGGGVCQTSSTLYLACLRANLKIVERHAHRYTPAYIPWGMDATVSWGGPDFQFSNDTGYPIQIVTSYADGNLTVRILGTNQAGTTTKITAETLSKTAWKTVYQDDPTLAPGAEKVTVTPYGGAKVKSYRNVYDAGGKLVSSRLEAVSDYKVRDKVVARGPAKAETPITPEPPVEAAPETPPETLPPEEDGAVIIVPEEPI